MGDQNMIEAPIPAAKSIMIQVKKGYSSFADNFIVMAPFLDKANINKNATNNKLPY